MSIYGTPQFLSPKDWEILNEIANSLQNQVSKLTSQRLHLQALIAKRDRLDYEIKTLKQVIQRTKKLSTKKGSPKGTPTREEALLIVESSELIPDHLDLNVPSVNKFLDERIVPILAQLKSEEELVEILERLPRLEDQN